MKAGELANLMGPFAIAANVSSIEASYNRIILHQQTMAIITASVRMWAKAPTEFDASIELEAKDFIGLVRSLPEQKELLLECDENKLRWECGSAKGGIALQPGRDVPDEPDMLKGATKMDKAWGRMFDLGSAACTNVALKSVGLDAAAIYPDKDATWCLSSDDVSIAACLHKGPPLKGMNKPVYIGPKEAQLVAMLCQRGGLAVVDDKMLRYQDDHLTAEIALSRDLKHNLLKVMERLRETEEIEIDLPRDQIETFIGRAALLSQVKHRVPVSIMVQKGKLSIFFDEQTAYAEEYYLAKVPDGIDYEAKANGTKLAQALANCDQLVADQMKEKHLIFRSKAKDFYYAVGGADR